MKTILVFAVIIVNLALISYSIAIYTQSKTRIMSRKVLGFLTAGIIFDITATILMILGSGNYLTVHGIVGYSSLLGMLTDVYFSYRLKSQGGINAQVSAKFNRNSLIAYFYWICAYITGALIVALK